MPTAVCCSKLFPDPFRPSSIKLIGLKGFRFPKKNDIPWPAQISPPHAHGSEHTEHI